MDLALSTRPFCGLKEQHAAGKHPTLPHPRMGESDYVFVPMEDLMHDPGALLS